MEYNMIDSVISVLIFTIAILIPAAKEEVMRTRTGLSGSITRRAARSHA